MQCAECGRDVGPGTRQFGTRVLVATKAGPTVVLCGSCGDPAKPFGRRWAIMEDPGSLAAVSTAVTPRDGIG
jgi:hypothetical protein